MDWKIKFDELSLGRGRNIFNSGRVTNLTKTETGVTATIAGTPCYEVYAKLKDDVPVVMRCKCPKYRGRGSCEHLAALLYGVYGNAAASGYGNAAAAGSGNVAPTRGRKRALPENAEETARTALEKQQAQKAAIIEAARIVAKREAEQKAAQEAKEAAQRAAKEAQEAALAAEKERLQKETQERIRIREEEKKAKKAERRRRRQEAEEANRKAQKEALQAIRQEQEAQQRAEAARQQEQARQRAQEEAQKKEREQEAQRRKEEKVRAALRRKEAEEQAAIYGDGEGQEAMAKAARGTTKAAQQAEAEKAAMEAAAAAGISRIRKLDKSEYEVLENTATQEKEESPTQYRGDSDGYSYFDFEKIRTDMGISKENRNKGRKIVSEGGVWITDISTGYMEQDEEMFVDVQACGVEPRGHFDVRLLLKRDSSFHTYCECPICSRSYHSWGSRTRNCAYASAVLMLAEEQVQRGKLGDATDFKAFRLLKAFGSRRVGQVVAEVSAKEESLSLEPRLIRQDGSLKLSFRVGEGKLYVIKDFFEFCSNVRKSATAVYGSNTQINHSFENFTKRSREWYGFINKIILEEERTQERMEEKLRYAYRSSRLNALELFGWRLDQFYEMLQNDTIEFEDKDSSAKGKKQLGCREGNPHIALNIRKNMLGDKKQFDGIVVSSRMPVFFSGVEAEYFVENGALCRAQKSFMEHISTLAGAAVNGVLEFQIGRKKLAEFYYSVLPLLAENVEIQEEDYEEIHAYLPPEVSFVFYLDADGTDMTCRVRAVYGGREFSSLDIWNEDMEERIEPFRQQERESEILFRVSQFFPGSDFEQDELNCQGEEALVYQVMEHGIEELAELGEVRATKRFQRMKLVRNTKVSVGVSVSEGLLDLDVETEEFSREELLDILKQYRLRKKYYRLKNGSFLKLEDDNIRMLAELMDTLRIAPREFVKGKMHIPSYRALYLDRLLEENESVYSTRDSRFRDMAKNFRTISDAEFEEPKELSRILRNYQKNGYKWLRTLEKYGFGGILADDMGLGKTLQMIAVLLAAKQEGRAGTSLIVCPASLVYNWEEELNRFASGLRVLTVTGTQEARQGKIADFAEYDVLVTSYDLLKRDIDCYETKKFLYEVIDEAQYIKNHTTAAAKAVKVITSETRFALTGTPIENRLSELWSIFDYLMPGFLYGYDVFKKEMETPIVKSQDEDALKRLQKMTGPFILRRLKQDVLKDLPDKLEEVRYVQFEDKQREVYTAQVLHMKEMMAKQSSDEFDKNKLQYLAELMRLRQICCAPSLCFENYSGESAKLEACLQTVESAIDGGHKILLFSQFTTMLELLQEELAKNGISFYTITGATPKEKRLQMVRAFNSDATQVFLISLKAGGVGLNLTGADVVIHYDPWWNVAAQNQATDRAHRIGQKNKVTVYKLIARQTIEEKIQKLQETKQNLADSIVNAQMGQLAGMSREDLLELLEV